MSLQDAFISGSRFKEKKILSSCKLDQIKFALENINPSIQDVNAVLEFNDEYLLRDTLAGILGKDRVEKIREAVYVTMIDSVNLHDDKEMIDEQEIDHQFMMIVIDVNKPDHVYDLPDRAYCSELIHTSSDNEIMASSIEEGAVLRFDATKPHAYLHSEGQSEKLLILSFNE